MTDSQSDLQARLECLRLAAALTPGATPDGIVTSARAFYQFVSGGAEGEIRQSEAPPPSRAGRKAATAAAPSAPAPAEPASDVGTGTAPGTSGTGGNTSAEETAPEPQPDVPEATRAVAQALSVDLAKAHGRDALVSLLADHAVARCGELAEDQLADYCADARGRIAG